jgi:hypothetical protein
MTLHRDPRGEALAEFFRREAGAVSLSADVTGQVHLVHVGLALLDAATLAQDLAVDDPVLVQLSEAGCFESMPGDRARFVSTAEIHRALLRPISGTAEVGEDILRSVVTAAGQP